MPPLALGNRQSFGRTWRRLPKAFQLIHEKPRGLWVRDAARVFIAGMDAPCRFLMMRAGYLKFEQLAIPAFRELSGFAFTTIELRWIYDYVADYMYRKERRLQPIFEARLASHKAKYGLPDDDYPAIERLKPEDIKVEAIVDGGLRRVM